MEAYLAGVWVRKFRTFKDTYYRFPIPQSTRRINVLLGKNGAGKSSLLDAIKQISAPPEANDAQTDVFSLVKINASFTGHEIWSGEPHAQMNSLLYGGPENLKVPAELFIHGTPLVHSQINDEEELSKIADPCSEVREKFYDLFAEPLPDQQIVRTLKEAPGFNTPTQWLWETDLSTENIFAEETPGSFRGRFAKQPSFDAVSRSFTLGKYLIAAAFCDPGTLRANTTREQFGLGRLGSFSTDPLRQNVLAYLSAAAMQEAFFTKFVELHEGLATVIGPDDATKFLQLFLDEPLLIVGNQTGVASFHGIAIERGALQPEHQEIFSRCATVGKLTPDYFDYHILEFLETYFRHPEAEIIPLFTWMGGSPFEFEELHESPLDWFAMTETYSGPLFGPERSNEEGPLPPTSRADLSPAVFTPTIIDAQAKADTVEWLVTQLLPDLHDKVFNYRRFLVRSRPIDPKHSGLNPEEEAYYLQRFISGQTAPMSEALQQKSLEERRGNHLAQNPICNGWGAEIKLSHSQGQTGLAVRDSVQTLCQMISERANQMAPAFITNNSTISVEATPPKTWRDDSARVSIALQRLNIDTWETISTPLSKLSAGIARWASIAVRLAMADLSASEWAWGDKPTLTKEQRNQLGIEWEPGTSFLSAAGNANEAPGSYDFWFIPEDWRFLAASLDTRWLTEKRSGQQSAVLLLDEPEVHLHLDAQREVKKWVIDLANDGFHIADSSWKLSEQKPDVSVVLGATIVATHSPLCLDYPSDQATTTFVFADTPERSSQSVMPEGFNLQETLKELGPKLGLTFTDAISLYKGFVIVEGPHDEEIINHFYKTELNKHRIGLLRAFGTNNIDNKNKGDRSFALYEQDLLTYIGLPVAILVDRATLGPGEKYAVNAFVRSCKKRGLKSWPKEENQTGGHPYPDIIAALPDEAVKAAFPKANFESWDSIVDEFENLRRKRVMTGNFKDFAKDKMGLQKAVRYPTFIQPVLKECEETLRPREGLENIMKQIFAFFEEE